jgi:excisionase family DNA binding protein
MIGENTPAPLCVRVNVAARMIGIGRTKFYELIGNGEVEVLKVGNATLITTASLLAFIERQRLQH